MRLIVCKKIDVVKVKRKIVVSDPWTWFAGIVVEEAGGELLEAFLGRYRH